MQLHSEVSGMSFVLRHDNNQLSLYTAVLPSLVGEYTVGLLVIN